MQLVLFEERGELRRRIIVGWRKQAGFFGRPRVESINLLAPAAKNYKNSTTAPYPTIISSSSSSSPFLYFTFSFTLLRHAFEKYIAAIFFLESVIAPNIIIMIAIRSTVILCT